MTVAHGTATVEVIQSQTVTRGSHMRIRVTSHSGEGDLIATASFESASAHTLEQRATSYLSNEYPKHWLRQRAQVDSRHLVFDIYGSPS